MTESLRDPDGHACNVANTRLAPTERIVAVERPTCGPGKGTVVVHVRDAVTQKWRRA